MLLQLAQKRISKKKRKQTRKKENKDKGVFKLLKRPMKMHLCLSFPSEDRITLQAHA